MFRNWKTWTGRFGEIGEALQRGVLEGMRVTACDPDIMEERMSSAATELVRSAHDVGRRYGQSADGVLGTPTQPLRILRPVPLHCGPCTFRAEDTFFAKTSVKIAYRSDNFTTWFKGKVETNPPTGRLAAFTLTKPSYDSEIIADLGGEEAAQVTLAQIWQLLERQSKGEDGPLLTNGYANIFYVRDVNGVLRTVFGYWNADGWGVNALELGNYRWFGDGRVFSSQLLPAA